MSALQWALLILAVIAVIAIYVYSRRDRRAMERGHADGANEPLLPPRDQQLDIFAGGQFDEFGVGKPRRLAPTADTPPQPPREAEALGAEREPAPRSARGESVQGRTPPRIEPRAQPARPSEPAPRPQPVAAEDRVEEKIIALLLAERAGQAIDGTRLHAALRAQGLEYGDRRIYHRLLDQDSVFSVASLVKPGYLDPAQAGTFSTPGLTLFMVLPGPERPAAAIRDMLAVAGRLAEALNGQVYDAKRRPLTPEAGRALQVEVESWARRNHLT